MKAFQRVFAASADPCIVDAFMRVDAALRATPIVNSAVKAANAMPEFTSPDTNGRPVSLANLLARGPVVISVYRGDWCDYCVMELAALEAVHPDISRLGATLIAISPQGAEARLRKAQEPSFPLLTDAGAKAARRCGIGFTPAEELRPIYAGAGRRSSSHDRDNWLLPLPATYVVDWTGEIVLSFIDTDYTRRLEPADIVAALISLQANVARDPAGAGLRARPAGRAPMRRGGHSARFAHSDR